MKSIYKSNTKPFAKLRNQYARHLSEEHKSKLRAAMKEHWRLNPYIRPVIESQCFICNVVFVGKVLNSIECGANKKNFCSKNCLDLFWSKRDTEE